MKNTSEDFLELITGSLLLKISENNFESLFVFIPEIALLMRSLSRYPRSSYFSFFNLFSLKSI